MPSRAKINTLRIAVGVFIALIFLSCSNRKNTAMSRAYHSINTRYNIHFNAQIAYNDALQAKYNSLDENLSEILYIYPDNSDTTEMQQSGGSFSTTIEKTTKAIKMHSIKTKPQRDRSKMTDPKYKAWLQQKEFNPFLYNTWMLLGKSEFEEGNYLRAITTFMYISKLYSGNEEIVAECKLWTARAYTEMGWLYEAENVLRKMDQAGGAPPRLLGFYSTVKANYLIRVSQYSEALPLLQTAISKEKHSLMKIRMKYLLGQVYTELGEKENAHQAFKSVKGLNTPYKYTFNADLNQIALSNLNLNETVKRFEKMASSSKNKEYLDRIYSTVGDKYIQENDTLKAIDYYKKAIEKSERQGYDKALAEVTLGDLYFERKEFIPAQPNYAGALTILKKTHKDYPRVYHRSSILDDLVVHVKTVYEQDSLQYLAQLPEAERLVIIEEKIKELKAEERKQKQEEAREKALEQAGNEGVGWNDLMGDKFSQDVDVNKAKQNWRDQANQQANANGTSSFYFYNPQTVEQGRIAFQKRWGNRKLEDDWRRKNKSVSLFGDMMNEDEAQGEDDTDGEPKSVEEDKYSPEYYLQQLPLTEEAVQASNLRIEDGLYNMGKIYKDRLEDLPLAINAFTSNVSRFPNNKNAEDVYYQLFLIYMQLGDRTMMANFRNKLIADFPEGQYSKPLSEPNYEWNFRHIPLIQDSLYVATYDAYLAGDVNTVRRNYTDIQTKYPFVDLMPKFSFLNALSYAQTKDVEKLSSNLKELIGKYPKADVTPLATSILERIVNGQVLLSDGTPIRGMDWSRAFASEAEQEEEGIVVEYKDNPENDYILLLSFRAKSVDKNELLYQVADYNFSNYVIQVHDLSFQSDAFTETLQIKGFKKLAAIKTYVNKGFQEEGLFRQIDSEVSILPISVENYSLLPRLGIEAYRSFFAQHYADQMPMLVNYWNTRVIDIPTAVVKETEEDEEAVEKKTETKDIPPVSADTELAGEKIVKDKDDIAIDKPLINTGDIDGGDSDPDKKDLNMDDVLSEGQLESAGKASNLLESAEGMWDNPVDGIKSLFDQFKKTDNMTKEEKAEIKELQRQAKEREKAKQAKEKAEADSIAKVEKIVQDSIQQIARDRVEREKADVKAKKDAEQALKKAKEDAQKEKEQAKKDSIRKRQETRKQRENEQKESRRAKEQERNAKMKAREEERKAKMKEQEQRRKEQERKKR